MNCTAKANRKARSWLCYALIMLSMLLAALNPPSAAAAPAFTSFGVVGGGQLNLTLGPDGNIWFTQASVNEITRITPLGSADKFGSGLASNSVLFDITTGRDGNLWFTDYGANKIGRARLAGNSSDNPVIDEFPLPMLNSYPNGITVGPDDNIWFTEYLGNRIGRITPSGEIKEWPVPTQNSVPYAITTGPDGNLWFTEKNTNQIGRITSDGLITEFQVPASNTDLRHIIRGPDNALWFTDAGGNRIWRYVPGGEFKQFDVPTPGGFPKGITAGPDGTIWFTEVDGNKIGRITENGTIDEFEIPQADAKPQDIIFGPDGNFWFTTYSYSTQGGLSISSPPSPEYWGVSAIIRFTPSSLAELYELPITGRTRSPIIRGNDGSLWFCASNESKDYIVRYTIQNSALETYSLPGNRCGEEMVADPNGGIWYGGSLNIIGRIKPGQEPIEWNSIVNDNFLGSEPENLTLGSDGNLWYNLGYNDELIDRVGRIGPSGPQKIDLAYSNSIGFSEDSMTSSLNADGSLADIWVIQGDVNKIWRIVPHENLAQVQKQDYNIRPEDGTDPRYITFGPDGYLWLVLRGGKNDKIMRMAPDAALEEYVQLQLYKRVYQDLCYTLAPIGRSQKVCCGM
jgi:streptogramin lyase